MSDEKTRPLYRWDRDADGLVEVQMPEIKPITRYEEIRHASPPPGPRPGSYVWSYSHYNDDFIQQWDDDGPDPTIGTYATKRQAQVGFIREELKKAEVLTPDATLVLVDLLEELALKKEE